MKARDVAPEPARKRVALQGWKVLFLATFRKDRRLNIRLSSKDLEAIQKRALAEVVPYQTLTSSLLHRYATAASRKSDLSPCM
jgi:predicted DNA binding CopG/RHH family protein